MKERLPRAISDELIGAIWGLGQTTMSKLIDVAPRPSHVMGALYDQDICLEPEFYITQAGPTTSLDLPRHVSLTVNEFEPYALDENLTMYSFRKLMLDTVSRRRSFERGVILVNGEGATIRPRLDAPAPGTNRRLGPMAWRTIRNEGNLQQFGPAEAREFTELATHFANLGLQQD